MKMLILGGNGMLGHKLFQHFSPENEVKVTLRKKIDDYHHLSFYSRENTFDECDVRNFSKIREVIQEYKPNIVINGVGITHHGRNTETKLSIEVNALLPHQVAEYCEEVGSRFIQISTDCVFNGKRGSYNQDEPPNNVELYGMTKYLGEVYYPNSITLRTSIIGLEVDHRTSLIEWFLSQNGTIKGFQKAIFSGLTTAELARVIEKIIKEQPELNGVWQIASKPISKYEILSKMKELLGIEHISIEPDSGFMCDRSLLGTEFEEKTGYKAPTWDTMLGELAGEVRQRD